jgi:tetratricopeptide (TPR) repeat protein
VGRLAEAEDALRAALAAAQKLVDGNSAASDFRNTVGIAHNSLGAVLLRTGKPAEAEAEFREALPIIQKLADDNPTIPVFRLNLFAVIHNLVAAVRSLGRAAEARDYCDQAIVVAERLVQESPTNTTYRGHLALSLRHRSLTRGDLRDAAGAAADARRALGLYEGLSSRSGQQWFGTACCHAALCGLSGHDGAAVSAAEGEHEAARAIAAFTRAAALGFRDLHEWRTNPALAPLRSREDFQRLMMDVAFPAEPFASTP